MQKKNIKSRGCWKDIRKIHAKHVDIIGDYVYTYLYNIYNYVYIYILYIQCIYIWRFPKVI
jgi:hypothetical protein